MSSGAAAAAAASRKAAKLEAERKKAQKADQIRKYQAELQKLAEGKLGGGACVHG